MNIIAAVATIFFFIIGDILWKNGVHIGKSPQDVCTQLLYMTTVEARPCVASVD